MRPPSQRDNVDERGALLQGEGLPLLGGSWGPPSGVLFAGRDPAPQTGSPPLPRVWGLGATPLQGDRKAVPQSAELALRSLPRPTGRPSRSRICFLRESRALQEAQPRRGPSSRAATPGEPASPAGSACEQAVGRAARAPWLEKL